MAQVEQTWPNRGKKLASIENSEMVSRHVAQVLIVADPAELRMGQTQPAVEQERTPSRDEHCVSQDCRPYRRFPRTRIALMKTRKR